LKNNSVLINISKKIHNHGGRLLVVGGSVRDEIMDKPSNDIDVEVYGLSYDKLLNVLSNFTLTEAGKAFSVIKMSVDGYDFDIALPRKEISTGPKHTDFDVEIDPFMSPKDTAIRRDFTMNAISYDPLTQELIDPLNGVGAIQNGIIDVTSETSFVDDPLRKMRAVQFISRFGLTPSKRIIDMAKDPCTSLSSVSKERLWVEWKKWALSPMPDMGLSFMESTNMLPDELLNMRQTAQDAEWHPEGDVFTHTKQVVRMAAWIANQENMSERDTLILVFSALCHDMGKPETTEEVDGRIRALGHPQAGEEPTISFLKNISAPKWLIDSAIPLVKEHLYHASWRDEAPSKKAVRKLSVKLEPSNISMWYNLVTADCSGRSVEPVNDNVERPPYPLRKISQEWLSIANDLHVQDSKPEPIVTGKHLIQRGVIPGPDFKGILDSYYQEQLDGNMENINELLSTSDCFNM